MKQQIIEEIKDIKYLFNYDRGRIISEQSHAESVNLDEYELDYEDEDDEFMDYDEEEDLYDDELHSNEDEFERESREITRIERELYPEKFKRKERKLYPEKYDLDDTELGEDFDLPTMMPGTKEKERTITTPGVKPGKRPGTPYAPKPGPKKNPKAEKGLKKPHRAKKGNIPDWLSFNKLGLELE